MFKKIVSFILAPARMLGGGSALAIQLEENQSSPAQEALILRILSRIDRELRASLDLGSMSLAATEGAVNQVLSAYAAGISTPLEHAEPLGRIVITNQSDARTAVLRVILGENTTQVIPYSGYAAQDVAAIGAESEVASLLANALQKSLVYMSQNTAKLNRLVMSVKTRLFINGQGYGRAKPDMSFDDFIALFSPESPVEVISAVAFINSGAYLKYQDVLHYAKKEGSSQFLSAKDIWSSLLEARLIDVRGRFLVAGDEFAKAIDQFQFTAVAHDVGQTGELKQFLVEQANKSMALPRYDTKLGFGKTYLYLRSPGEKLSVQERELLLDMIRREPARYVHLLDLVDGAKKTKAIYDIVSEVVEVYQQRGSLSHLFAGKSKISTPDAEKLLAELKRSNYLDQSGNPTRKLREILVADSESFLDRQDVRRLLIEWIQFVDRIIGVCDQLDESSFGNQMTVKAILKNFHKWGKHKSRAAGFAIQDRDFFLCVDQVVGDPFNIVGLPLEVLYKFFRHYGIQVHQPDIVGDFLPHPTEQQKIAEASTLALQGMLQQRSLSLIQRDTLLRSISAGSLSSEDLLKKFYQLVRVYVKLDDYYQATECCGQLWERIQHLDRPQKDKVQSLIEQIKAKRDEYIERLADTQVVSRAMSGYKLPNQVKYEFDRSFDRLGNLVLSQPAQNQVDMMQSHLHQLKDPEQIRVSGEIMLTEDDDYRAIAFSQFATVNRARIERGMQDLIDFMREIDAAALETADPQVLDSLIFRTFDNIIAANCANKVIEKTSEFILDERESLLEQVGPGAEGKKILITAGNNGAETFFAMFQAFLWLLKGFDVELTARSEPMMQYDTTRNELLFVLPYFDGILARKGINGGLSQFIRSGRLQLTTLDSISDLKERVKGQNDYTAAILLGEDWYSAIVGRTDLSSPPYNDMESTILFNAHAHKTRNKPLAIMNEGITTDTGDYVHGRITLGWGIAQIFLPEAHQFEHAWSPGWRHHPISFHLVDLNSGQYIPPDQAIDLRQYFRRNEVVILGQLLKECRAYAGLTELASRLTRGKTDSDEADVYEYITPHKYIQIRILADQIQVDVWMEYNDDKVIRAGGTPWDEIKNKIPDLIVAAFMGCFYSSIPNLFLMSSEQQRSYERLRMHTFSQPVLSASTMVPLDMKVIDVRLPLPELSLHRFSAAQDSGHRLLAQVMKKNQSGLLIRELVPVTYDPTDKTIRFRTAMDSGEGNADKAQILQVQSVVALPPPGIDSTIHLLTEQNFLFSFVRNRNGTIPSDEQPMEKLGFDARRLEVADLLRARVVIAPVDGHTTMSNRTRWNKESGPNIAYTELVRIGNFLSQAHHYNPAYWSDPNYLTGLPRLRISDGEFKTVVQLAGPHNLPIEMSGLHLFPDSVHSHDFRHTVDLFVQSARLAEYMGASAIDINMGGPALGNQGGGIWLAEEWPDLAVSIVRSIVTAVHIPVCIKTRILSHNQEGRYESDPNKTIGFIRKVIDAGAQWVAIHTRLRDEGTTSEGKAIAHRPDFEKVVQGIRQISIGEMITALGLDESQARAYLQSWFEQGILNFEDMNLDTGTPWLNVNAYDRSAGWLAGQTPEVQDFLRRHRTPVLANGEVLTQADVESLMSAGADGVMIWKMMTLDPRSAGYIRDYMDTAKKTPVPDLYTAPVIASLDEAVQALSGIMMSLCGICTGCAACSVKAKQAVNIVVENRVGNTVNPVFNLAKDHPLYEKVQGILQQVRLLGCNETDDQ